MLRRKVHSLRFRAVNRDIFEAIRNGKKKVETRAATKKFRNIKAGDKVKLVCGRSAFQKKVRKVRVFKTIESLLRRYRIKEINPSVSSKQELMKLYYSFPGYREKLKRYGIIGMELE